MYALAQSNSQIGCVGPQCRFVWLCWGVLLVENGNKCELDVVVEEVLQDVLHVHGNQPDPPTVLTY